MLRSLPDRRPLHCSQLDDEPQYVKKLPGNLEKQEYPHDPDRDSDQEECHTREQRKS